MAPHPGVKVFVGNLPEETSHVEVRDLFEPGEVLRVAFRGKSALVYMRDVASAERAILKVNGKFLHGNRVVVKLSRNRPVKIFVGNLPAACTGGELRLLFQDYGSVVERDFVKDYALVHTENIEDARTAIQHLNGWEVKGKKIVVKYNKARKRGLAGHTGQLGNRAEKNKIPTLDKLQPRNDTLRSGNLAFPAGGSTYSSLEYDYQQRLGNNNLTKIDSQDSQARQVSPSYFGRDRSPIRHSPTRAGYILPMAAQQASYRDQASASLGTAYRDQPAASLGMASALTSYSAQAAAYGAQVAASQVPSYEAQPTTTYAATYGAQAAATYAAASYGAQAEAAAAALSASYRAQPAANQAALYGTHPLSTQSASYGVQSAVDHAASYGAQAAANLAAAYSMQDAVAAAAAAAAASYKTQLSASLSTAYRAQVSNPAETAYAAQQSTSVPLAAGYRAQPSYNGLTQSAQQAASYTALSQSEAAALHPPYVRIRLSPPRGNREDLYRKAAAMNKRYCSDLSDDRRLTDLSDFRHLTDSPHSPTKAPLDYRRLPETQSDYA